MHESLRGINKELDPNTGSAKNPKAAKKTGGKGGTAPRKQLATKVARKSAPSSGRTMKYVIWIVMFGRSLVCANSFSLSVFCF